MRIALFMTCLDDTVHPGTGRAVVRLLERLEHPVDFPTAQTCCGQMLFNTGYRRECLSLVRRFVGVFGEYDAVVTPSGSCAAMVRTHHAVLARLSGDTLLCRQVDAVAHRMYELSELLVDVIGVEDVGAYFPHRVTYHPTCHSLRTLRLGSKPTRLLRRVRGLTLLDLPAADECCGFGGTFALKNADVSVAMGADKLRHVRQTGADVLVAGDNSCLMHVGGMLSRLRGGVRTMHLAEVLTSTEDDPR